MANIFDLSDPKIIIPEPSEPSKMPALEACTNCEQNKDIPIIIMINSNGITHAGLMINEGKNAILYDPGGHYSGCYKREVCKDDDGGPIERGTGDAFYGIDGSVDWGDYIAYQLDDGPDVTGYKFNIPRSHGEKIINLIDEIGGQSPLLCAITISNILMNSGGIFENITECVFPSTLGDELYRIPNVEIIKYRAKIIGNGSGST